MSSTSRQAVLAFTEDIRPFEVHDIMVLLRYDAASLGNRLLNVLKERTAFTSVVYSSAFIPLEVKAASYPVMQQHIAKEQNPQSQIYEILKIATTYLYSQLPPIFSVSNSLL